MPLIAALLAALAAAAATPQDAGPAGAPETVPVVSLTEGAQIKELCAALRESGGDFDGDPAEVVTARRAALVRREDALSRWYRLEIPSKGFVFGRYRPAEKLIELDGDRPLRALDGYLALDLEGVDDVAFDATPAQVSQWSKEKKASALKLAVVFRPSGDRCAGSAAAESFRLAGRVRSWQLLDAAGAVAAADADGEPVGGPPHAVKVEKVSVESDPGAADDEGQGRLAKAQRALDKCAVAASRRGSLVLSFQVEAGRVREPQVIMDGLRDEKVSECVAHAVAGVEVGGAGHGTASLSLE